MVWAKRMKYRYLLGMFKHRLYFFKQAQLLRPIDTNLVRVAWPTSGASEEGLYSHCAEKTAVRARVVVSGLRGRNPCAKLTRPPPPPFHVTLRFLRHADSVVLLRLPLVGLAVERAARTVLILVDGQRVVQQHLHQRPPVDRRRRDDQQSFQIPLHVIWQPSVDSRRGRIRPSRQPVRDPQAVRSGHRQHGSHEHFDLFQFGQRRTGRRGTPDRAPKNAGGQRRDDQQRKRRRRRFKRNHRTNTILYTCVSRAAHDQHSGGGGGLLKMCKRHFLYTELCG